MWLLQLRVWGCWGCSRWGGPDGLRWADSFKRASPAAPHPAALSLQVTEWGGFRPSCALGELGGYKKRRRRAAGRQRRRKERTERQQAPEHSLTNASMASFSTITASFLLFLVFQVLGQTGANPVYGSVSNADLMDFKVGPGQGPQSGTRGFCDPCWSLRPLAFPVCSFCKEFAGPFGGEDAFRR